MRLEEIGKIFIKFYESPPRNHKRISPAPLVSENDPSTLFTSSGMQPLVPYLMGESHPEGKRLVDIQPCLRVVDMDEVADGSHLTYFEMLGNWSLGDYFKKEQLAWYLDFLTKKLGISKDRLRVSVFKGNKDVPKDEASYKIWKKLGIKDKNIFFYGVDKNWWSRSGTPDEMPEGEIGGPDSEVFYDFGEELGIHENSSFKNQKCHPNCGCGRFLEIGNSVFMQYKKEKGKLIELPQKNVDFGGGLERVAAVLSGKPDVFLTPFFDPVIKAVEVETSVKYGDDDVKDGSFRIIADHLRASVMLISEGVFPSNKLQGYILRRLIRRSMFHLHLLGAGISGGALVHIAEKYREVYKNIDENWAKINEVISGEGIKFGDALDRGLNRLRKALRQGEEIDGRFAFNLYQSYGFPLELTVEILKQNEIVLSPQEKEIFEKELKKHKKLSRSATKGIFKGGLADAGEITTKYHTATHLLHAALRKVLGKHIEQKGSNITSERLRFDFSNGRKLTNEEIKRVEDIVNEQIKKDLPVVAETKTLQEALKEGALAFFRNKYGEKVKVYTIGDPKGKWFSKEVCGGPHVSSTSEIGHVRIKKQEKIGAGITRLYAVIDKA